MLHSIRRSILLICTLLLSSSSLAAGYTQFVPGQIHSDDFIRLSSADERVRIPFGIAYPRWATAVVLDQASAGQGGLKFRVDVRQAESVGAANWKASLLLNDVKKSWDCQIASAPVFTTINCGMEKGWQMTAEAPAGLPPELFDLQVTAPDGSIYTEQNAVKVIPNADDNFYMLSINDLHMDHEDADAGSGTKAGNGTVEGFSWYWRVLNTVNPRFVVMPGDIWGNNPKPAGAAFNWDKISHKYIATRQASRPLTVPLMMDAGNHDSWGERDTPDKPHSTSELLWNKEVGYANYTSRIKNFLIYATDWTCDKDQKYASSLWAETWKDPAITYRLEFEHYNSDPIDKGNGMGPEQFKAAGGYPDVTFCGHAATYSRVKTVKPWPVYVTHQCQGNCFAGYYRFTRAGQKWTIWPTENDMVDSIFSSAKKGTSRAVKTLDGVCNFGFSYSPNSQNHADWGKPKVAVAYEKANDGSATINSARISNMLPLNFDDGRVKFYMAKGTYSVQGGEILAQYDYENGAKTAVLVKVNIPASPKEGQTKEIAVSIKAAISTSAQKAGKYKQ